MEKKEYDYLFEQYKSLIYQEGDFFKNKDFFSWLEDKKRILRYYEAFLETMDFIPERGFVELPINHYESIVDSISNDELGLVVSKSFNKNERIKDKKIIKVNGTVDVIDNNPYLIYKNNILSLEKFNFFITNLPLDNDIDLFFKNLISETNKKAYIGIYGDLSDLNRNDKLRQLYDLKTELKTFTGKNIEGEYIETKNYYMAAITNKYKLKKKTIRR